MKYYTQKINRYYLIVLLLVCAGVSSETIELEVSNAYVTALIPGQEVSAGYMTIRNFGDEDQTLRAISSTAAQMVQLHETTMSNGMMSMGMVQELVIPSGGSVVLQPGGMHLMIMGVDKAAFNQASVEMQLGFANGENMNISVPVKQGY